MTVAGTTMDRQFFRCVSTCALPVLLCGRFLVGLVMRTAVRLPVASVNSDGGTRLSLPV